jgi:hypothetical protein
MGLYEDFATNPDIEKDGVVLEYGNARIRIARAGGNNTRFSKRFEVAMRPYRRQLKSGTMDEDTAARLMREVYADTVILGWEGVTGRDKAPLAFTRENVLQVLTDLPDLFADIQEMSNKVALFREEIREDDAKN